VHRSNRVNRIIACFLLAFTAVLSGGCETVDSLFFKEQASDGRVVQTETRKCWILTPENAFHPVGVCEDVAAYEVKLQDRQLLYPKAEFRSTLRERLREFVQRTAYPSASLGRAVIQVWLLSPVFEPEKAGFVAVVLSAGGNFLVRLPLEPSSWFPDAEAAQLLGKETFPTRLTRTPGTLVLQAKEHVTRARLNRYLTACGVDTESVAAAGMPTVVIKTPLFGEAEVARRLLKNSEGAQIVQELGYLPAGGAEGAQALFATFPFTAEE
jgi:hypothetical protein